MMPLALGILSPDNVYHQTVLNVWSRINRHVFQTYKTNYPFITHSDCVLLTIFSYARQHI